MNKIRRPAALWLALPTAVLAGLTAAVLLRPPLPADTAWTAPADGTVFRLDLNDASAEELDALPGIGPALAEGILTRRAELGAFTSKDDVLSVPGIGEATFAELAPYITYGDEVPSHEDSGR